MAYSRGAMFPWPAHLESCRLHDDGASLTCAGYLRRGNLQCTKRATVHTQGTMPMCKLHSDQLKTASHCRLILSCGFECARVCEWVPMGVQRCEAHSEVRGTCYFLEKLPIELRIRIYGYLLPSKEILAKSDDLDAFGLPSDRIMPFGRKTVYMAICRLNRQFHDEVSSFLYGSSNFSIWLEERGVRMCNSSPTALPTSLPGSKSTHVLQDYQMQLMLLEQQNKKRLLAARREQDRMLPLVSAASAAMQNNTWTGSASVCDSRWNPSITMPPEPATFSGDERVKAKAINYYPPVPLGASWEAPLATCYFSLIQSFRIIISFVDSTPHQRPMRRHQNMDDIPSEEMLYMYSDQLHRIVSRLQATQRRIYRLEVTIRFEKQRNPNDDFKTVQLMLKPFKRLCGVQNATVICWDGVNDPRGSCIKDWKDQIEPYIASWKRDVEGVSPAVIPGREWEAYWGLERLMTKIAGHCQGKNIDSSLRGQLQGFADLRHKARIAREEGHAEVGGGSIAGEEALKSYVAAVTGTWWEFVDWERRVQMSIGADIDAVWRLVGGASGEVAEGSGGDEVMG